MMFFQKKSRKDIEKSLPSKVKATQRQLIYETIERMGTATCWEVEKELNLLHQSASIRITELVKMRRIFDTGERRLSGSKRRVRVYKVVERDIAKLKEELDNSIEEYWQSTKKLFE